MDAEPQPVVEHRWEIQTFDEDGEFIEQLDVPGGTYLELDLPTLDAASPRRVYSVRVRPFQRVVR